MLLFYKLYLLSLDKRFKKDRHKVYTREHQEEACALGAGRSRVRQEVTVHRDNVQKNIEFMLCVITIKTLQIYIVNYICDDPVLANYNTMIK